VLSFRKLSCVVGVAVATLAVVYLVVPEPLDRSRTYTIGYQDSPPRQYVKADGRPAGPVVEMITEAARREGLKLRWIQLREDAASAVAAGRIDLYPLVHQMPERENLHLTRPYTQSNIWLLTRSQANVPRARAFSGRRVAAVQHLGALMVGRFLPGAIPVKLPDAKAVAESVCSGAAAAAIVGDSTSHLSASQRPAGCELRITPVPNARIDGGIAANPTDAAAREAADLLRKQLAAMAEDGTIASISLRWQFPPTNEVLIMEHLAQARQATNLLTFVAVFAVLGSSMLVLQAIRFRQARRVAESAMSERSRFLAALSHEIRTPMGAIIGMAELALDTPLNAEQRDYLTTIRTSSTSLLSILNDTLDISKAEAGKIRLTPTEFRVRDGLADILQSLSFRAQEKGLELVCHVEPAVPDAVLCDAGRLRQILVNLAGNAIKFTDSGEVLVRVSVEPAGERATLRFVVADTGIGVPKGRQESIFLPFEQGGTATQDTYGGTGLGLTISSRLVDLMGGRIWLESPWTDPLWEKQYSGSAFQFTVAVDLPRGTPPWVSSFKGTRALVVAVNATQRRSLVEILREWGMEADTADGVPRATEALRAARAQGSPYGVAVLDLAEETWEIRQDKDEGDWAGTYTVVISSAATRSHTAGAYGRRTAAHLLKPVKPTVMHSTIRALLDPATSTGDLMHLRDLTSTRRPAAGSRRVLVAEDNLINQRLLRRLLEKRGHKVYTVSNGRDAILLLEQESADVVLMDVEMPVLDGLQATAELRSREKEGVPRVPIVAITAHALAGDRERFLKAGFDGYLAKPVVTDELYKLVESIRTDAG